MTLLRPPIRPERERDSDVASPRASGRNRHLTSAGQILGVGLLCFGLWLLLDARQLYDAAQNAPLGVRRSVAMSVLRPIARVTSALSLDRLVDGANEALGRSRATTVPNPPPPRPSHHRRGGAAPPAPRPSAGPPALIQPTPRHPLTVLEVGDSLGEDLGYGLANVIGTNPSVRVVGDAVESTGLANVGYYDWPSTLEAELARYRPKLVVVMLGGNDTQNFMVGGRAVVFGTPSWQEIYGARVATMMSEATRAGAQVIWVGMPVMESAALTSQMARLDDVFEIEAAEHRGVTYLSTWKLLENRLGAYSEDLPDARGNLVEVREPDGIHIADPGGDDLLADAVLEEVARRFDVVLAPGIHAPSSVTAAREGHRVGAVEMRPPSS